jgi:hypothetical protein
MYIVYRLCHGKSEVVRGCEELEYANLVCRVLQASPEGIGAWYVVAEAPATPESVPSVDQAGVAGLVPPGSWASS